MPINMSHCRHHNTLLALREVHEQLDSPGDLSPEETQARDNLLLLCALIAGDYETEIEEIAAQRAAKRRAGSATE